MKTKLISFILSFAMLVSLCTMNVAVASTDTTDYKADIEFINALGLGEINPSDIDKPITRKEAVLLSMGLYLGRHIVFNYDNQFSDISPDDENAGMLALAVKNGIVSATADGRFVPDGKVSYIDGIKMVFNCLNYCAFVEATGQGDVRYHMLANEYDVNVSPKAVFALTVGEMAHLVAMAAEAPYMVIKSTDKNGDIQYDKSANVTSLSFQHGIETIEAVVTQNEFSSLITKDSLPKGEITLGGITLKCSENTDTRDMLGRKIKAYYKKETKDLIYYKNDINQKIVKLMSDDIKDFNTDTDSYIYYSGNATKTHRINTNAAYIYNGVALTSADAALILAGDIFTPTNGYVELIDNGSGFYCVKITDYKTYIVAGVDTVGQKIIDKYGLVPLDYYGTEKLSVWDTEGKQLSFEYIDKDNVLFVEMPLDNSSARIIVAASAVEGMINSYNDGIIQIEGETYEASDIFKKRINAYGNQTIDPNVGRGMPKPKKGEYIVLYLDAFGKVANYMVSANNGWKYGYTIQKSPYAKTLEMEPSLQVRLLTEDSEVTEMNIAKNFTFDGRKYTKLQDSHPVIAMATLVRYRVNTKGEIKEMDSPGTVTDNSVPGVNEDASSLKEHYSFVRTDTSDYRDFSYVPSVNAITFRHYQDSGLTTTKYFKDNAIIFTVPLDANDTNEKNYDAKPIGSLVKDEKMNGSVKVYWEDEDEIVNTVLVRYSAVSSNVSQNVYIVDKVTSAVTDDGDNVWKFYLMNGGVISEYTAAETGVYNSLVPLTCGDIIRASITESKEIKLIERTFDWENDTAFQIGNKDFDNGSVTAKNPYSSQNLGVNDELFLLSGRAIRMNNNIMEIAYGTGQTEQIYINGRVVVVEKGSNGYQLRVGTVADIVFDPSDTYSSRVVIDARYVVARNIIVYK